MHSTTGQLSKDFTPLRVRQRQNHIANTAPRQTDDGALWIQRVQFAREQAQGIVQAMPLRLRLPELRQPLKHALTSDRAWRDPPEQMFNRVDPVS